MDFLVAIGFLAIVMATLGGWIASQKGRETSEGVVLGFAFGPLGILVEALLPNGKNQAESALGQSKMGVDDEGIVAYIADRYRSHLDDSNPCWTTMPPRQIRSILKAVDKQLQLELKFSPTKFSDYAAIARRSVQGTVGRE